MLDQLYKKLENEVLWKTKNLKRNEYLKYADRIDTNLYYVLSGSIRLFIMNETEEITIRFAYENSFFSALDSFISEKPSLLYIQAIKATKLKYVPKAAYMEVMNKDAENLQLYQNIMEQLVLQQFEREIDILIGSPLERYKRVLKRSPQLFQEIPNKYIASYLRMSAETLSRIKKS